MSKELTKIDEQANIRQSFSLETFETMKAIAMKMHGAKCFSGNIENAEQAFVIIQAGYEMGIAPVEALNSFYIVKGKITIYGVAMAKRVKMHGWKIKVGGHDKEQCELTVFKDEETYSYTAKKEQVENLGAGRGKNAYHNAPEDKLYWHAMSRIVRRYIPEVLGSVSYTHEEIQDAELFRPNAVDVHEEPTEEEIFKEEELSAELVEEIQELKSKKEYEEKQSSLQQRIEKLSPERQTAILVTIMEKLNSFSDDKTKKKQPKFADEDVIPNDVE